MDEEYIEVELDTDAVSGESIPDYEITNPQLKNLARILSTTRLGTITGTLMDQIREDDNSRQDWLAKLGSWLAVYNQEDYNATQEPFLGASKDHVPILTEAVNQFSNRAIQTLFNQSEFIRSRPFGNITQADLDAAKRVEKHMNYCLMIKDKSYKTRLKQMLKSLPLYGSFFRKRFFNTLSNNVEVVNIEPKDMIIPQGTQPCHISELDRKTHRYWITQSRARRQFTNGFFTELLKPEPQDTANPDPVTSQQNSNQKMDQAKGRNLNGYIEIWECHTFLDLNDDGMEIPVIVWIAPATSKIVRIAARYRVNKQKTTISSAPSTFDPTITQGIMADNPEFGEPEDYEPIEYFTHFFYQTNPNGFYGEGMGTLLGETNRSVNRMLRQSIDAGTLSNIPSGYVDERVGIPKGETRLRLGEFLTVNAAVDDIRKGIYQHQFAGPNPALIQLFQAVVARTDRLGMLTEAVTGTTEKVIQPTTFLNLIEQGLQPFTAAMVNVTDALTEELGAIYKLIGENLNSEEYWAVLDGDELKSQTVSPLDYQIDMDMTVIADPKLATDKQREDKAQRLFEVLMNNPLLQQNPEYIDRAYRMLLAAYEVPNIDELLPPTQSAAAATQAPAGPESTPAGIPPELLAALGGGSAAAPTGPVMAPPGAPQGAPQ